MEHKAPELAAKLNEMYPKIKQHGLALDLEYKPEKKYWVVKLHKGDHKLHTLLDEKDASSCLEGVECVYLGVQVGQFIENFERFA